jgi:hypothetical protein
MRNKSTFLVCNLDLGDSKESFGVLTTESQSAPLYSEIFQLVNYYISERHRISELCLGAGISTIRDPRILREWRGLDEILRPHVFKKIGELPIEEQSGWLTLIYREQMKMCFVLNQQATVDPAILLELRTVIDDVRRRKGQTISLVDQDPARSYVKDVLRCARRGARFSLQSHSSGKRVQGLTVVDDAYPLVTHPLVSRHLSA